MSSTIYIDGKYNGAVRRGNGGYICGAMAAFIEGTAEIRISRAFPVETKLSVQHHDDGSITVSHKGEVLGTAKPAVLELEVPAPPTMEEARDAGDNFIFAHDRDVKGCYVCSPKRAPGEGLRLFCGVLPGAKLSPHEDGYYGNNVVAGLWRLSPELGDSGGVVDEVYIWSALDCPGGYAIKAMETEKNIQLLGTCIGTIKRPLSVAETCIVSSWPIKESTGRKLFMGVAIHTVEGELVACASQVWIDVGKVLPGG